MAAFFIRTCYKITHWKEKVNTFINKKSFRGYAANELYLLFGAGGVNRGLVNSGFIIIMRGRGRGLVRHIGLCAAGELFNGIQEAESGDSGFGAEDGGEPQVSGVLAPRRFVP